MFALGLGLLLFGFGWFKAVRLRKRRRQRHARVTLASAEAAADDAYFAADAVSAEAAALHRDIVAAWTARDREALARSLGPDLLAEWVRRLDDFDRRGWHNVCEIKKPTEVEYLGLTNREDDTEDRVVVRLTAELRDVVIDRNGNVIKRNEEDDELTTLAEYWTLGRAGDRWILHSIEQDAEGAHQLDAPIVASPWSDDARLHDEAVTELAVADAVPDVAGLVDVDYAGDGRTQALDLSVVDGRFAPAVLEAAARRAVEAWAEAVDGADAALERAATPEAAHALLYPRGENTRLVVRGPKPHPAPDRRPRRRGQAADLHRRGGAERPPLPRGPRHRRRHRGLQGPRHDVHRALDARARRRPRDAVADRRHRRRGLALLLAVPNVSEGRDAAALDAIGAAFVTGGARLLDVHTDPDHHRSVFTLAGEPGTLHLALLEGAREAVERIDLTAHAGVHPRVGVLDVAPVVHRTDAERGAAVAEALLLAHRLGARPRPPRLSLWRTRGRAHAREPARARRARRPARPTTARRSCTRPPAPRSSRRARRWSRSTSSSSRPRRSRTPSASPPPSARAAPTDCPASARSACSSPTPSRSRPTSRTTAPPPPPTSWPPSPATRPSRRPSSSASRPRRRSPAWACRCATAEPSKTP